MNLDQWLLAASQAGARTLLLIAGQPVAFRVGQSVEIPYGPKPLTFHETQALVQDLLTPEAMATLDQDGTVETPFSRAGLRGTATVFYGQGAHNIVLHLGF